MLKIEFTVADAGRYNSKGPIRWILSHVLRYKLVLLIFVAGTILAQVLTAFIPSLTGSAFTIVLRPSDSLRVDHLFAVTVQIALVVLGQFLTGTAGAFASEVLAQRVERDARDELYLSLLGKSQTFHNRQRRG